MTLFWHATFGIWTINNLFRFFTIPKGCVSQNSWSLLNYQITICIGCYSASLVTLVTALVLCAIPYALFVCYKNHRARTAQIRRIKTLKSSLIVKDYDPRMFPAPKECCICLGEFQVGEKVTPLPCNKLHIFHYECIKETFDKTNNEKESCPMCR